GWTDFFFQAEDGIRDRNVTGVQTCALPISDPDGEFDPAGEAPPWVLEDGTDLVEEFLASPQARPLDQDDAVAQLVMFLFLVASEIGRASCRGRVGVSVGGGLSKTERYGATG